MKKHVVIVGAGFAGMSCAKQLLKRSDVHITLIDKNNYHQFQPLLYQVATCILGARDVATSLRTSFRSRLHIDIKMAEVVSIDPQKRLVHTSKESYSGDFLVLATGSVVNFFDVVGAKEYAFPLYSLQDAERLRSHILTVFEQADRQPALIDQGLLTFVVVGAGPTGTEMAGALTQMIHQVLPKEYSDISLKKAKVVLVDHGQTVLRHFSTESQNYATKILTARGVTSLLGLRVEAVARDHVTLSDGTTIDAHTTVWAGGLKAPGLASACGLTQGQAGRIVIEPDFTVKGFEGIYVLGDSANILADGKELPQLAAVAQQSGYWAAKNIANDIEGKERLPFQYKDKGIMAIIGRDVAVCEVGKKRRQYEGLLAFLTWLGVHVVLLSNMKQRISTIIEWMWDYFAGTSELQIIDRQETE